MGPFPDRVDPGRRGHNLLLSPFYNKENKKLCPRVRLLRQNFRGFWYKEVVYEQGLVTSPLSGDFLVHPMKEGVSLILEPRSSKVGSGDGTVGRENGRGRRVRENCTSSLI